MHTNVKYGIRVQYSGVSTPDLGSVSISNKRKVEMRA